MGCDHEWNHSFKCRLFLAPLLKLSELLNSCELPVYPFDYVIGLYFWVLPLKTLQGCLYLCWTWSDAVVTGCNHFARTNLGAAASAAPDGSDSSSSPQHCWRLWPGQEGRQRLLFEVPHAEMIWAILQRGNYLSFPSLTTAFSSFAEVPKLFWLGFRLAGCWFSLERETLSARIS